MEGMTTCKYLQNLTVQYKKENTVGSHEDGPAGGDSRPVASYNKSTPIRPVEVTSRYSLKISQIKCKELHRVPHDGTVMWSCSLQQATSRYEMGRKL